MQRLCAVHYRRLPSMCISDPVQTGLPSSSADGLASSVYVPFGLVVVFPRVTFSVAENFSNVTVPNNPATPRMFQDLADRDPLLDVTV
jgi:hypothetical protein